jgi:hypothetical protein
MISEKAMLVNVKISQWTARKYDRAITAEVNHTHQAADAGRFNKLLIPKERISPIQRAAANIRLFHYDNTLAWADEGDRLLPVANFFEYSKNMNALKEKFEAAVNDFVEDYHIVIDEARRNLNGLFNPADYPSDIRDKFAINFSFMPVPDANDFRVALSKEELDFMRASLNTEVSTRLTKAVESLLDKIREQLVYTYDRLREENGIFRDSLFTNLVTMADMSVKLNVTNDPKVNMLIEGMRNLDNDPQTVRDNPVLRADIVYQIQNLLAIQ